MVIKSLKKINTNCFNSTDFSTCQIIIFCLLIFFISRCFFFLEYSFITNNFVHEGKTLLENIWRWDAPNYANIALKGYENTYHLGANCVWLPLWPLMLKLFSLNGLLNIQIVGIITNQILLLGSLILISKYFIYRGISIKSIKYSLIFLSFAPINIYFFTGLTEATFLFITILSFYLLEQRKIWACVLIGALLSGLKIVGLSFVSAFIYFQYKERKLSWLTIVQAIIMSLPLLAYMVYLQVHIGDFLGFIHAQKEPSFGRPGFDFTGDYVSQISSMYMRATVYDFSAFLISLLVVTGILWYHKFHKEAIFNLACIIPIFISGGLWNSFRMGFCLFTTILAITIISQKAFTLKLIMLIISTAMTMICLTYWLSGSWFFA